MTHLFATVLLSAKLEETCFSPLFKTQGEHNAFRTRRPRRCGPDECRRNRQEGGEYQEQFGGTWWVTLKPRNVVANKGGKAMKTTKLLSGFALAVVLTAVAWGNGEAAKCKGLPSESDLQALLQAAPACVGCSASIVNGAITTVGGLFIASIGA